MEIRLVYQGNAVNTAYRAEINASYKALVKLLGQPNSRGDGCKIDAEWVIEINGKIMTIYNWKDGQNYLGRHGLPISKITQWHIGGHKGIDFQKEINFLLKQLKPKSWKN